MTTPSDKQSFLRSPIGLALCGFLIVAAFLLITEHRAHIFVGNWFVWLLPFACLGMHFFHGHGGHGGHQHNGKPPESRP